METAQSRAPRQLVSSQHDTGHSHHTERGPFTPARPWALCAVRGCACHGTCVMGLWSQQKSPGHLPACARSQGSHPSKNQAKGRCVCELAREQNKPHATEGPGRSSTCLSTGLRGAG